jgi:integrase
MHAALRAALSQAQTWDLVSKNAAIGVKLPTKKPSKPTQLLTFQQIKAVIEHLPEPTRTIVTLVVFGSMRVGEALALRWNDILEDCIVIDERLYDGDLDDPKTLHGSRRCRLMHKVSCSPLWAVSGRSQRTASKTISSSLRGSELQQNAGMFFGI